MGMNSKADSQEIIPRQPLSNPPKLRALAFDCDGTITEDGFLEKVIRSTMAEVMAECGFGFDEQTFRNVFAENKGGGITKYYMKYLEAKFLPPGSEVGLIMSRCSIQDMNERVVGNYVRLIDAILSGESNESFGIRRGVREVILEARNRGLQVAVVTNADRRIVAANLKAAGLCEVGKPIPAGMTLEPVFFDVLVHRGNYSESQRKPEPYPYLLACDRMGVSPLEVVGFEDSANGHKSLRAADIGLRVHFNEAAGPLNMAPVFPHPKKFPHEEEVLMIPAHEWAGADEFSVDFLDHKIIPAFNARALDRYGYAISLRRRFNLPFCLGDRQLLKLGGQSADLSADSTSENGHPPTPMAG